MTAIGTTYEVEVECEDGGSDTLTITVTDGSQIHTAAAKAAREWVQDGEWGSDGATVTAWYTVTDEDGDEITDREMVVVEIEADRTAIMEDAIDGDSIEDFCGYDDYDHDWTADVDVVGGLKENPGVFATGGTKMTFVRVCADCGIVRTEYHCGSQRNPGEHDRVKYSMPEGE